MNYSTSHRLGIFVSLLPVDFIEEGVGRDPFLRSSHTNIAWSSFLPMESPLCVLHLYRNLTAGFQAAGGKRLYPCSSLRG